MKQRNLFSRGLALYSDIREKIRLYAEKHPEKVIAAMFLILLIAVTTFLISKAMRKDSNAAGTFINRLSAPSATVSANRSTANIMDLLSLYGKAKAINPDSITLKDSLLIKEVDKDLKNILDEKD